MRIPALILLLALVAVLLPPECQAGREKRTISTWFSKIFKGFKKSPRRPVYATITRPISYPPPSYGPPPPPPPSSSYGVPPPTAYGAPDPHGGGDHGVAVGHSGIGDGHHGGGGASIPHGFGPLKDHDIINGHGHGSGSHPTSSYSAPVVQAAIPVASSIGGDISLGVGGGHAVGGHVGGGEGFGAPVASSIIGGHDGGAAISNEYRAPPSFPPPMAAHGSSSSSYLEAGGGIGGTAGRAPAHASVVAATGTIIPSPAAPVVPQAPAALYEVPGPAQDPIPAAPAPLYDVPAVVDAAPAPLPLVGDSSVLSGAGYAPLGHDDPIIEIVFEDGDPLPPAPAPVIDPQLFALPEDPVEVYFVEVSHDDTPELEDLDLSNAQQAILEGLPEEIPADLRSQLIRSGVLDDAQISIIDQKDVPSVLDLNSINALEAAYAAESQVFQSVAKPPQKGGVDIRVKRLFEGTDTPAGLSELIQGLGKFREGRFAGVVEPGKEGSKSLPLEFNGNTFPIPNIPSVDLKDIGGVLVLALDESSLPIDNLVEEEVDRTETNTTTTETSTQGGSPAKAQARAFEQLTPVVEVDREWYGDPNGWRPVWN